MSGCFYGPFISTDQPVNCPYEVYEWENLGLPSTDAPIATVMRNNVAVDVTGTIEDLGSYPQTVDVYTVDCDGNPVAHTTTTEAFHHWRFTLSGANAGETLYVNGSFQGQVMASGTCSTQPLTPTPQCSGMYDWSVCEGTGSGSGSGSDQPGDPNGDDTGCNAGGASGLGLAIAIVGVLCVRKRKHRPKPVRSRLAA